MLLVAGRRDLSSTYASSNGIGRSEGVKPRVRGSIVLYSGRKLTFLLTVAACAFAGLAIE
jgi:hypothetical protein